MSWDQRTGDPSPAASRPASASDPTRTDPDAGNRADASTVRIRGLALLATLEALAPGSREHADSVATYAFAIAVERGLERGCCELIREAARLHDVGRLYLDPSLAQRPTEALSAAELSEAERSRAAGAKLAWGAGVPERACEWVAAASERYDGSGPAGKRGEEIPLAGRITRVACAYVEVVERTAAAPPLVRDEPRALALSELRGAAGTTLDGQVVEAMAAIIARAAPTPA